jgi:hypothetical protein
MLFTLRGFSLKIPLFKIRELVLVKGLHVQGYAVAQLVEAPRYKPDRWRVRFPMESLAFFSDLILPVAL